MRIRVTREVDIPDPYKLELYRKAPELGPRILFFSGGTALRKTSRALINYTHNSIHLITPFDSGGSSAVIREAFSMPAVGDIRNRLMALADQTVKGNPEIFDLFVHRLSKDLEQDKLRNELDAMAAGRHPLVRRIPAPMRKIIRNHFHQFLDVMPDDFNLKGASLGNLMLTAGYLANRRQLDPVIYIFSKLVEVRGMVRPTVNKDLHLAVKLTNGDIIVGQHNITGKEVKPLASPIDDIWLTESLNSRKPVEASIRNKVKKHIEAADLICYPIGSFYTSIIANLLPKGIGEAVAANPCPKVFVPNTGNDPETKGVSVTRQVELLKRYLARSGAPEGRDVLGYIIVDSNNGQYPGGLNKRELRESGLDVIDCNLTDRSAGSKLNAERLSEVLLSLT